MPAQRGLERLRGALVDAVDGRRQPHLRHRLVDLDDRVADRDARAQVEGDRHRRQLSEVRDRQRADGRLERGDAVERHQRAARRAHVEQRQHRRVGLVARLELHHHPVLVGGGEDGRHLALTVRVVERVLDGLRRHAERGSLVAIDLDGDLRLGDLQVAGDVDQARAARAASASTCGAHWYSSVGVRALQRVLIRALGELAADADRGDVLHVGANPAHLRQRSAQLLDDDVGAAGAGRAA